jgi:RNA polymerase sigma-70 factor (ECF subfamily)
VAAFAAVKALVDQLYREHAGALVSALTRVYGPANLERVEAIVHETFLTALQSWSREGVPENPAGWLRTVARHRLLDDLRREGRFAGMQPVLLASQDEAAPGPEDMGAAALRGELPDDQLQMMFVACHPALPLESQLALTLRTLCGLEVPELARALLATEATIEKRLVRARQRLREEGISFELPGPEALGARLDGVLRVLYLLFNEGYSAHSGERHIREELCQEAIRLVALLVRHSMTDRPRVHALLALMLLQSSRLGARVDEAGNLLTLAEQDRRAWNQELIRQGLEQLATSAEGSEMSEYHLEAGIAACHAVAPRFEDTDWARIVRYYDQLLTLNPSPVIALNRAIAVGYAEGAQRGLDELRRLESVPELRDYGLLHAAAGDLLAGLGDTLRAREAYVQALDLAGTEPERRFLQRKLALLA